jgi:hypothetical protein
MEKHTDEEWDSNSSFLQNFTSTAHSLQNSCVRYRSFISFFTLSAWCPSSYSSQWRALLLTQATMTGSLLNKDGATYLRLYYTFLLPLTPTLLVLLLLHSLSFAFLPLSLMKVISSSFFFCASCSHSSSLLCCFPLLNSFIRYQFSCKLPKECYSRCYGTRFFMWGIQMKLKNIRFHANY